MCFIVLAQATIRCKSVLMESFRQHSNNIFLPFYLPVPECPFRRAGWFLSEWHPHARTSHRVGEFGQRAAREIKLHKIKLHKILLQFWYCINFEFCKCIKIRHNHFLCYLFLQTAIESQPLCQWVALLLAQTIFHWDGHLNKVESFTLLLKKMISWFRPTVREIWSK